MRKLIAAGVISLSVLAAVLGGAALLTATATPVEAKPCNRCPLYCIGVTCDDGNTYCNSCLAACAGAHNCVTTGL